MNETEFDRLVRNRKVMTNIIKSDRKYMSNSVKMADSKFIPFSQFKGL